MGDETETTTTAEQQPYAGSEGGGMDPSILVVLLLVLAFVTITNIWLRNRAQGKPTFPGLQRVVKRLLGRGTEGPAD